jgi:SAM-dependent methyltransferase
MQPPLRFWVQPEPLMDQINFACPRCHTALEQTAPDELCCAMDGLRFQRDDQGIWRFLLPERAAHYEKFMREYETVRRAEGRGVGDPAYYRALPYRDLSGHMVSDWRIRAASFDVFLKKVVVPLEEKQPSLRIIDLGAGNGWLSARLAGRGHIVAAVDLLSNDFDGLGCYRHYEPVFTPVQAEFDRLPFAEGVADLLIFNASLHYSVNIHDTLHEALRVLAPTGRLAILDSPLYRNAQSGAQMVKERESRFAQRFGFPSNALPSENYLTYTRLQELGSALNVRWQMITPYYGLRWILRPLKAKLLGQREPARFHVIVGSWVG